MILGVFLEGLEKPSDFHFFPPFVDGENQRVDRLDQGAMLVVDEVAADGVLLGPVQQAYGVVSW